MPERLECEVLQKARYINTLTFFFLVKFHGSGGKCNFPVTFAYLIYTDNFLVFFSVEFMSLKHSYARQCVPITKIIAVQ